MAKYQFLVITLVLVYAAIASTTSPEVTYEPCDPNDAEKEDGEILDIGSEYDDAEDDKERYNVTSWIRFRIKEKELDRTSAPGGQINNINYRVYRKTANDQDWRFVIADNDGCGKVNPPCPLGPGSETTFKVNYRPRKTAVEETKQGKVEFLYGPSGRLFCFIGKRKEASEGNK